jgi:hypothetical protein
MTEIHVSWFLAFLISAGFNLQNYDVIPAHVVFIGMFSRRQLWNLTFGATISGPYSLKEETTSSLGVWVMYTHHVSPGLLLYFKKFHYKICLFLFFWILQYGTYTQELGLYGVCQHIKTFAKFSFRPFSRKGIQIMLLATSTILYAWNMWYQTAFSFQLAHKQTA